VVVPRLRLLGYQPSRPNIRLVRLPELEVEPSPVRVNDSVALDYAIRREGWIALKSHRVWGVPIPLDGPAFVVGPSFDFLPSHQPRAIWLNDGNIPRDEPWRRPWVYLEYDGVARQVIDRIEVPAEARLVRDSGDALFASAHDGWYRRERTGGQFERVDERTAAQPGALLRTSAEHSSAEVINSSGAAVPVELPIQGSWGRGSTSPDGRHQVFDVDVSGPPEPHSFTDIAQGRVKYTPRPHRLGIIDLQDGSASVAEGVYDNFAYKPVWSDDGQWLVFYAPFQRNRLWACNVTAQRLESISFGRRSPPAPLVNVTDLVDD
jgi:hypothetical protein